jgi:hypothetical protein
MITPKPSNETPVFESFPEYHNFPSQWDLSELDRPSRNGHGEPSAPMDAKSAGAETPIPLGDSFPVFTRDPFPKLKTLPVYWDLSR